jgi:putative ABC transport system permease protein
VTHRKRALQALEQDIRDHIERETEDNIAKGMPADEARRAAYFKFGNIGLTMEDTRAVWTHVWLEQLLQDIRYALRTLGRNPIFTSAAVVTLALVIGMNTAVFSVVNAVLLRPLGYPDSTRLVWISTYDKQFKDEIVPRWDFSNWRKNATSFEAFVAYASQDLTLAGANAIETRVASVSEDFWRVSAARVDFGRLPGSGETDVLLLSHRLFETEFNGDPNIIGRPTIVDGQTVTIAGVLGKDFRFEFVPPSQRNYEVKNIEAYMPLTRTPQDAIRTRGRPLAVVGKLKADVPIERARAELETIRKQIAASNPSSYLDELPLSVVPLQEKLVGAARPALWILMASVLIVLLIASANLANLQLARFSARHNELTLRTALGAGFSRILRQFIAENLILVFLGTASGVVFGAWAIRVVFRLIPQAMPRLTESAVDAAVVAFAMCAAFVSATLFAIVPAFSLRKTNLQDILKANARTSVSHGSDRVRRLLVVIQMALATLLLIAAALMVKSMWRLYEYPAGFNPASVLVLKVPLSEPRYAEPPARYGYIDEALLRFQSVPGVQAAAITTNRNTLSNLVVQGEARETAIKRPQTVINATSAGYASALGLRLIKGRWINDNEPALAVVVNESLVRRDFGNDDPLGTFVWMGALTFTNPPKPQFVPVVGVVADLKHSKLDVDPEPELYVPYRFVPMVSRVSFLVRLAGDDPIKAASSLRSVLSGIDKTQPITNVATLQETLADSIAPRRFNLFLLGTFATAALLLAMIGIYGVIAYSVVQRKSEIGVRIAVGASRGNVIGMVVRQGIALAMTGILVGVVGSFGLTRLIASLLYEVEPTDPVIFAIVTSVLLTTAIASCCGPAIRAAFIDPVIALRND